MRSSRGDESRLPTRVDADGGDAPRTRARARRKHRIGASAIVVSLASLVCAASAAASGSPQGPPAGPTSPPFTQCPAIGNNTSCGYLIDVTSTSTPPEVLQDASQGAYDEGNDDVTVGVQNDSNVAIGSVHIGVAESGDNIFGFDGDGGCSESSEIPVKPEGCPFGPAGDLSDPYDYWGPDAELNAEAGSSDAGTVTFPTPLQPGQYTYFTLEAPPSGSFVKFVGYASSTLPV